MKKMYGPMHCLKMSCSQTIGKSTSIILELATGDDETENRFLIYNQVRQIVEKGVPGNEKHYIAGLPVVTGGAAVRR